MKSLPLFFVLWLTFSSVNADSMFSVDGGRVEHIPYNDKMTVKIGGVVDMPFLIELDPNDPIEDVARLEKWNWEIVKRGTRIFVRALPGAVRRTVVVTTKNRSYVFDLVPMKNTPANVATQRARIVFDYPVKKETAPAGGLLAAALASAPNPAQSQAVKGAMPVLPFKVLSEEDLDLFYCNDAYTMEIVKEASDIRPREAFDDGRFTYLKFPNNVEIPTITKSVLGKNEDQDVKWHLEGDYVVLHDVSPMWTLRLGGSVIGIYNESFDPEGKPAKNGSTIDGAVRLVKQAKELPDDDPATAKPASVSTGQAVKQ